MFKMLCILIFLSQTVDTVLMIEPSKVIRDMLPIIDPEEDYLTIVAAEEKIINSEQRRKKELEEAHATLKGSSESIL